MTYVKINFGSNFEDEFQKAVDEIFHLACPAFKNYECIWRPQVDVYESVDEIIVLADMAGINKEDLHIEVERKKIKIAGIRKVIQLLHNARYCQAEIPHGYFERNIALPDPVDAHSAAASYADGILVIRMNKLPAGKTHRVSVISTK
ncbi:MAG: Hsp20/alpha crystallin family protein [Deltaproteobacteria bacterium]|nr:Hsp20/alpha crystallin family protein [Deltaproteobacteria bacterium]